MVKVTESTKTILIVDDDDSIRNLISQLLERLEYRVLKAKDSDEAFRLNESHIGSIDLLITDQVMPPFMNGNELANCMRLLRPEIKVLYISGYAANHVVNQDLSDLAADFLPKPFKAEILSSKVKRLLDAGQSSQPLVDGLEQSIAHSSEREGKEGMEEKSMSRIILVMEKDAEFRGFLSELLRSDGYSVLEASSIGEAIRISHWHTGMVDVFLSDGNMLTRSGKDLTERVRHPHPGMKVISILSDGMDESDEEPFYDAILRRPISPADLRGGIKSILDSTENR